MKQLLLLFIIFAMSCSGGKQAIQENQPKVGGQQASIIFKFPFEGTQYAIPARAGKTIEEFARLLSTKTGVPSEYLLFYAPIEKMFDGYRKTDTQNYKHLLKGAQKLNSDHRVSTTEMINVFVRPVVGDHIHLMYNIWIHDGNSYQLVRPLFDGEPVHVNPAVDGETSYFFVDLHNGLHTHGKGLMHIHPWSSPKWLHSYDGLQANLGGWLDTVDVTIRKPPYKPALSLQFSNGIFFISKEEFKEIINNTDTSKTTKSYDHTKYGEKKIWNTSHKDWKVLFWKHYIDFKNGVKPTVIKEDFEKIWLGNNLGIIVFIYGPKADVIGTGGDFKSIITNRGLYDKISWVTSEQVKSMTTSQHGKPPKYLVLRQFDGQRYPSIHTRDNRYKKEDEQYRLTH